MLGADAARLDFFGELGESLGHGFTLPYFSAAKIQTKTLV
jgi:hypothetical protein